MELFYILTLLIGLFLAVVMQNLTIAIPFDAHVAQALVNNPDQWSIQADDSLSASSRNEDLKTDVTKALKTRLEFQGQILMITFFIILSVIGLLRERKIKNLVYADQ